MKITNDGFKQNVTIRHSHLFAISVAVSLMFMSVVPVMAQTVPPLGVVRQFGALGGAGVSGSTGLVGTTINGDVGSSPTPTITNFPPSKTAPPFIVHFTNDAVVQQAHLDAITLYNNLFAQGTGPGVTPLGPALGGQILGPGVYRIAGAADLTGVLTLNDPTGTGIFIFSIGTTLTANVLSSVGGTANPCNVYFQVGTSATLNGNNFFGTVIADQSVTVASSNNLMGRVVGVNGAITLPGSGGNTIGGCSAAAVPPPLPPPTLIGVNCPSGLLTLGANGVATITLSSAAPVGGTTVLLSSSAPGTASVPASVVVPAGATTASFNVTPGATPGAATISATTSGVSMTCSLIVGLAPLPPTLIGVNCPSGLLTLGANGVATVTLSSAAPAGGTTVLLSSSAPGTASVPASVVVPAGATTASFTVTPGATPGGATISATTGGVSVSCSLIVGLAPLAGAVTGATLDPVGMTILLVLLAAAGIFAANRFGS